jgi:3-isopropylmalate dehydratase small subunit
MVTVGDRVTGYYDGDAPALLIYPPQYQALVMVKENPNQNVKVDYFNNQLVSSDGRLRLNISPYTQKILTNGQLFSRNPANRDLIVIYGPSTKSIPAQTTPYKIIVLC